METVEAAARAGVYVHLPFCSSICPYCDFAVMVDEPGRRRRLVEALLVEIESVAPTFAATADTIYFGGGTPSLHSGEELARIVASIDAHFDVVPERRIFLEANPEDVTVEKLRAWRSLGVRTLSLGVQSLEAPALRFLGRRHSVEQAYRAVETARAAGVETVSVDLIYGRPGQTVAEWRRELEAAAALQPDHLSCYQLTVHRRTRFGRMRQEGALTEMPDEEQAELFVTTHELLADLGFTGYEVSNFARGAEHRSRHNEKYWSGVPYLGLGPSAHSFDGRSRWWNVASTPRYVASIAGGRSPVAETESLSATDRLLEELMLGLRRTDGIDLGRLERRYGVPLRRENDRLLEGWRRQGRVRFDGNVLRPTLAGLLVADRLAAELKIPAVG